MKHRAGRKKIPVQLKIISGTLRECRENKDAPKIASSKPKRPSWVSIGGRKHWNALMRDLQRLQVVTPVHGIVCGLICDTLSMYLEQREIVEKEGQRYATKNQSGNVIVRGHPTLAALNESKRLLVSMASEFGLTAASTSRVSAIPGMPPAPQGDDEKETQDPKAIERKYF